MRLRKGKPASYTLCFRQRLPLAIVLVLLNRKYSSHLCGSSLQCEMTFDDHAFPQVTYSRPSTLPFDRCQRSFVQTR
jgi:hypothetical protein